MSESTRHRYCNAIRTALLIGIAFAGSTFAHNLPKPSSPPSLTLGATGASIAIDGDLDEPGWSNARQVATFIERYPGDNAVPDVGTRSYLTFDKENLYVAFVCYDDPATIRATMCPRDQFSGDDAVVVSIDTYGEASWAYELHVNPYGVQKDYLWSTVHDLDSGFDMVWHSAAIVTDSGYQVEIAIPFSSMRFPGSDRQQWKVDLRRYRPRNSFYQYAWSPHNRDEHCDPCQWGTVSGIEGVRPGKGLELLPTYVAYQSGSRVSDGESGNSFDNGDILGELSLGAKYALSSDATIEATYNPDFSQIESDAAQVDVNSTIALFYPERRPFFQEGSDVFRTLFNSFYTRTVNDPEYAVKIITRTPKSTLGIMSAQDENTAYVIPLQERSELVTAGRSWVNAIRGTHSIGRASQVGFIVTDRRFEGGGYGSILAADADIRLSPTVSLDGQFIASFTGEADDYGETEDLQEVPINRGEGTAAFDGESFSGNALIAQVRRATRTLYSQATYSQCDPGYRTLTGYDPWVDYRDGTLFNQYVYYPTGSPFERVVTALTINGRWHFDGSRNWEYQTLVFRNDLRWAQTQVELRGFRGSEAWMSRISDELHPYNDLYGGQVRINGQPSNGLGYSVQVRRARSVARHADAIGNESQISGGLDLKPIDRVLIEPDLDFINSFDIDTDRELFRQFIARTKVSVQVTRELSLRVIVQHNYSKASILVGEDISGQQYYNYKEEVWNIDPLVTYQLSPFSVLYAGATSQYEPYPTSPNRPDSWRLSSRQFYLKLQYLFRV